MKEYSIITGAAGLLGEQHAIALANVGFSLILTDIDKKKLLTLKDKLKKAFKNTDVIVYPMDITNEKEIISMKRSLLKQKLKIAVLVNNAALNPKMKSKITKKKTGTIESYSIDFLKKEMDVNLISAFAMVKHFGCEMAKNKKGSIINIGSDLSVNAPDQSVYSENDNINNVKNFKPIGYSISKFGIIGLTKYVATYWAHRNVRCNALIPGAVENHQPTFLKKNVSKRIPMRRWAKKDEYRKGLIFLATDDSSYMTGQLLIMDGGRTVW
jgi:NAD(P)-dependent dehydrogenase (short-subunit alcohol dehydrogenase family)